MRRHWIWSHWLGILFLVLVGCRSSQPDLKPPPEKEAYNVPPERDKRYNEPYKYPSEVMNDNKLGKKSLDPANMPKMNMNRGGMGP